MKKLIVLTALAAGLSPLWIGPSTAEAHVFQKKTIRHNISHINYVCENGSGKPKRWHCKAQKWKVVVNYERRMTDWRSYLKWLVGPSVYSGCALPLIGRESGGVVTRWNYEGSGAYGLGQALPPSKMAPYGSDYMTNGVTQIKWMNVYVNRYGGWCGANAFQLANGSY